jgi:LuxR family maltose regulon positive regulatory protein
LALDEQDNDPLRFWVYCIKSLQVLPVFAGLKDSGETALTMLQAPQPPALTTIMSALINDLAVVQEDIVLVLDDFHVINDTSILQSCRFLLDHLPSRIHLLLAGRSDPHLALPRFRARGLLSELRDHDLHFTHAETMSYFSGPMELALAESEIDVLEQRSEGWIAGLQLAALAMRARADHATFVQQFNGSQRFIREYLQEEILERQPQEVQDFLLYSAIVTRLQASLCQAITTGTSVQAGSQILSKLEQANLFLVPLDKERCWYRFRSLFRDMLLSRLRTLHPEMVPILHQRLVRAARRGT